MTQTRTIDLLIVDDHPLLRDGIRMRLEAVPRLRVVGEADDSASALREAERLRPDIALVDISMPDGSGIELVKCLRSRVPSVRVVMLTMHSNPDYEEQSRQAGASAYVLKDQPGEQLIRAIQTVALECDGVDPIPDVQTSSVTPREAQVLERIAKGWSTVEIARDLGVSPRTIDEHRSNLIRKFELRSAADLVRFAVSGEWRPYCAPAAKEPMRGSARPADLQAQLTSHVESFARRTGIDAQVSSVQGSLPQLDARACAELLRVAGRALGRIEKRARARVVRLETSRPERGRLRLAILSDDYSFAQRVLRMQRDDANWLDELRASIADLGGFLAVAEPGSGTALHIDLPVQKSGER